LDSTARERLAFSENQDPISDLPSFAPHNAISPLRLLDPEANLLDASTNSDSIIAPPRPETAWSIGYDAAREQPKDKIGLVHNLFNRDEFEELVTHYDTDIGPILKLFNAPVIVAVAGDRLDSKTWWTEYDVVLNGIAVLGLIVSRKDTTGTRINHLLGCLRLGLLKRIPRCERTEQYTLEDEVQSRCFGFVLYLLALRLCGAADRIWEARCEALDAFNKQSCRLKKTARADPRTTRWHAAYVAMKILNAEICFDFRQARGDDKLSRVIASLPSDPQHPLLPFLECTTALECMAPPALPKGKRSPQFSRWQQPPRASRKCDAQRLIAAMEKIELLPSDSLFLRLFKASNVMLIMEKLLLDESSSAKLDHVLQKVIDTGVEACKTVNMVTAGEVPWWDLARLPYRFLMILLTLNRADSLAQVPPTYGAIYRVTSLFPGQATQDMLTTAKLHINLWHDLSMMHSIKMKRADFDWLISGWDWKSHVADLLLNQDSLAVWLSTGWRQHLYSGQTFTAPVVCFPIFHTMVSFDRCRLMRMQ